MKIYVVLRNDSILGVFRKIETARKEVEKQLVEDLMNREEYVGALWVQEHFVYSNTKYRVEVFWKKEYEYDEETIIHEYFIKEYDVQ